MQELCWVKWRVWGRYQIIGENHSGRSEARVHLIDSDNLSFMFALILRTSENNRISGKYMPISTWVWCASYTFATRKSQGHRNTGSCYLIPKAFAWPFNLFMCSEL
jgi:hypothetical protein